MNVGIHFLCTDVEGRALFIGVAFFLPSLGPRDQTQVFRLDGRYFTQRTILLIQALDFSKHQFPKGYQNHHLPDFLVKLVRTLILVKGKELTAPTLDSYMPYMKPTPLPKNKVPGDMAMHTPFFRHFSPWVSQHFFN